MTTLSHDSSECHSPCTCTWTLDVHMNGCSAYSDVIKDMSYAVQHVAVCSSACCSVLQCMLQCVAVHVAVCCSACCSVLQHDVIKDMSLITSCCNTLRHFIDATDCSHAIPYGHVTKGYWDVMKDQRHSWATVIDETLMSDFKWKITHWWATYWWDIDERLPLMTSFITSQ